MRPPTVLFALLLGTLLPAQEKQRLKRVSIVEVLGRDRWGCSRKRLLLEVRFDSLGQRSHVMHQPCSITGLDIFLPEGPFPVRTNAHAVLARVSASTRYSCSRDSLGRIVKAEPQAPFPWADGSFPLRWSFRYGGNGVLREAHSSPVGLRAGGADHRYAEDGSELVLLRWHPRGFIASNTRCTYREGLPRICRFNMRSGDGRGMTGWQYHYTYY